MEKTISGTYIVEGKNNQKLLVEWAKLSALSEEFSERMILHSDLGIESFSSVELDFLAANPKALKEDGSLAHLYGLKGEDLKKAVEDRLRKIFCTRPSDLSEEMRSFMKDVEYYFVRIKEVDSGPVQGFIVFMTGGPIPKGEYKITVLAVDKNSRRQGLAGLLVASLKKIEADLKKVLVSTRPTNESAIRAYKKWGFEESEKQVSPHFIDGHWVHLEGIGDRL